MASGNHSSQQAHHLVSFKTSLLPLAAIMVSYVVTGAGRGIGLAIVRALHARILHPSRCLQGHNLEGRVFAIDQDLNSCDGLKRLAGPNVHIIPGDLDKPETLHVGLRYIPSRNYADQCLSSLPQKSPRLTGVRWIS